MKQWNRIALAAVAAALVGCEKPIAPPSASPSALEPSLSPTLEEPDIYDAEPSTEEPSTSEFPFEEEIPEELKIADISGTNVQAAFLGSDKRTLVGFAYMKYKGNVARVTFTLRATSSDGATYNSPPFFKAREGGWPYQTWLDRGGELVVPRGCGHTGEGFGEFSAAVKAWLPKVGVVTLSSLTDGGSAQATPQDPCPPPGGAGGGGDAETGGSDGDVDYTYCWDHYEWDLTTDDITLLWSSCPKQYATYLVPESGPRIGGTPERGAISPRLRASRAAPEGHGLRASSTLAAAAPLASSSRGTSTSINVPFALVDKPLPKGARAVAARRGDASMPEVILVTRFATAGDIALAVASLRDLRSRTVSRGAHVETIALSPAASPAPPELEKWSAAILRRLQAAPVVHIKNHGHARVVYALLHP